MRRILALLLAVPVIVLTAPAVPAGGTVTVVLTTTGTDGAGATAAACPVGVAEGAGGFTVFAAAVSAGCISGYSASGGFVTCIDGVCDGADAAGLTCMFWIYTVNGVFVDFSWSDYRASDGDIVSWALEPFGSPLIGFC